MSVIGVDEFGGCSWCGCLYVGYKIDDGYICFMFDIGYDGNFWCGYGVCYWFFVEGLKIFNVVVVLV